MTMYTETKLLAQVQVHILSCKFTSQFLTDLAHPFLSARSLVVPQQCRSLSSPQTPPMSHLSPSCHSMSISIFTTDSTHESSESILWQHQLQPVLGLSQCCLKQSKINFFIKDLSAMTDSSGTVLPQWNCALCPAHVLQCYIYRKKRQSERDGEIRHQLL